MTAAFSSQTAGPPSLTGPASSLTEVVARGLGEDSRVLSVALRADRARLTAGAFWGVGPAVPASSASPRGGDVGVLRGLLVSLRASREARGPRGLVLNVPPRGEWER